MGDCERRVTTGATIVERAVAEAVRQQIASVEGRASSASHVGQAVIALESAQANYEAALRAFGTFTDQATVDRLLELRAVWDEAQARVGQLGGPSAALTISVARDWDWLTREEHRALIQAVVERVTVAPGGAGAERLSIRLFE